MKTFINLLFRMNLAPQGEPDTGGAAPAADTAPNAGNNILASGGDSRQKPSGMTLEGKPAQGNPDTDNNPPANPDTDNNPPANPDTDNNPPANPDTDNNPPANPDTDNNPPANPDTDNNPPANPEPAPWEVNVPEEYKKAFAPYLEKYQKMGLSPEQAQTFVDEGIKASKENDAKIEAEILSVKTKWGPEFETKKAKAVNAMAKLGFTTEQAAAMVGQIGLSAVMERFYEISKKMNPGELKDGKTLADIDVMDAQAANNEIERLTRDSAFCDKLANGDAAAKARWEKLKAIRRGGK